MPKIREYPEASRANSNDALILDTEEGTKYIKVSKLLGPSSSTVDRMTASGSVVHFEDGADNVLMKSVKVSLDPVQDLHGYDHPWPAGGGENVLPPLTSETKNGVTITVSDDGTVTINGTATDDTYFDRDFSVSLAIGTTMHIMAFNPVASSSNRLSLFIIIGSGNPQINLNTNNAALSVTASTDTTVTRYRLRVPSGVTYTNFIIRPMLKIGETAPTVYSPYSNICPITGWTGAKVTRTGKNLLNPNDPDYDNYTIGADGTPTTHPKRIVTGFISCDEGVSLTFSTNKKTDTTGEDIRFGFAGIAAYDKDKNFLSRETANRTRSVTMVTPTGTKYVRVFEENTSAGFPGTLTPAVFSAYGQQLELGSTATDYEPYFGQTYDITFPTEAGTVYGGTLNAPKGELVVDRAMVDLTEGMSVGTTGSGYVFYKQLSNVQTVPNSQIADILNEAYTPIRFNGVSNESGTIALRDNQVLYVNTGSDSIYPVGKAILSLATPITYQLTPQEITSLLGENNLWADTGDSEVGYRADTKLYIDAKIAELQALVLENNGGN